MAAVQISKGLRLARELSWRSTRRAARAPSFLFDMISPQYYADWWLGCNRRAHDGSQVHRELAPRACPALVGFKNGTTARLRSRLTRSRPRARPTIPPSKEGHSAIVSTNGTGLPYILPRSKHPNYDAASVDAAVKELAASGLEQRLMSMQSREQPEMYQRQIESRRGRAPGRHRRDRVIG